MPARCFTSPSRFVPLGVSGRRRSYSDSPSNFPSITARLPWRAFNSSSFMPHLDQQFGQQLTELWREDGFRCGEELLGSPPVEAEDGAGFVGAEVCRLGREVFDSVQ